MINAVKIIRSSNRKRTVSARLEGDTLIVHAPEEIPGERLSKIIESFKKRFTRSAMKKEANRSENLGELAEKLNQKYFGGVIQIGSIEYVASLSCKFGVCNTARKEIRISHVLAKMPDWVRKYVIVHEMAHIIEPNHGAHFWELVNRYELAERARGYLMAKGMDTGEEEGQSQVQ